MTILLESCRLSKRYGAIAANNEISFQVRAGEIHALVGENGAGKSTFVNMLFGQIRPDSGAIRFEGREVYWKHPGEALSAGVGLVQQHVTLVPDLTVTQNVLLGIEPRRGPFLDLKRAKKIVQDLSERYGLMLNPEARVETLSVAEQQQVEIAKVLARGVRILMFDEPTAVLVPAQIEVLLTHMRRFARQGLGIVFITHKLPEVESCADYVTILRQGRVIWSGLMAETDPPSIAKSMIGYEAGKESSKPVFGGDKELSRKSYFVLSDVEVDDGAVHLGPLNLSTDAGEILGVAGVAGNGQELLLDTILGHHPLQSGKIILDGRDLSRMNPRERLASGIAYVPQDRIRRAVISGTSLADHLLLRHADSESNRLGWIRQSALDQETNRLIHEYDIAAEGPHTPLESLSGGHQQRSIFAFELDREPQLLILHDPTHGLDIRATQDIHQRIRAAAERGASVLLVSSDLNELLSLSDRVAVIFRGNIVGILEKEHVELELLGSMMTGVSNIQRQSDGKNA